MEWIALDWMAEREESREKREKRGLCFIKSEIKVFIDSLPILMKFE
jgi:hypothetical protein